METTNDFTPMPRIGDPAPNFDAQTTQGKIHFPSDFNGKWVILFSHPSDFTPVCTSEFVVFGHMAKEFEDLNCQLVGLSIGGIYSHIAWLRAIKEKVEFRGMKNVDVRFPLIADQNAEIAKKYGMVHPGENTTMAVRAVFYIDPQGIIRAIIYYPLALGRNFEELKRVLVGLQAIDKYNVALPADWQPGEEVIAPTPATYDAVEERMQAPAEGAHCSDWFFCLKKGAQER